MARTIDINDRNAQAVALVKQRTLRALGSIRGVGELSRGYVPLNGEQVEKVYTAMKAEVDAAHTMLKQAIELRPANNGISFDL